MGGGAVPLVERGLELSVCDAMSKLPAELVVARQPIAACRIEAVGRGIGRTEQACRAHRLGGSYLGAGEEAEAGSDAAGLIDPVRQSHTGREVVAGRHRRPPQPIQGRRGSG